MEQLEATFMPMDVQGNVSASVTAEHMQYAKELVTIAAST
jgi:sRNA-binding protein